jgi:hypothetical protein
MNGETAVALAGTAFLQTYSTFGNWASGGWGMFNLTQGLTFTSRLRAELSGMIAERVIFEVTGQMNSQAMYHRFRVVTVPGGLECRVIPADFVLNTTATNTSAYSVFAALSDGKWTTISCVFVGQRPGEPLNMSNFISCFSRKPPTFSCFTH